MKLNFKYYLQIRIILMTFLVLLASMVLIRLGLWQVERYYFRQIFNANYIKATQLPVIDISKNINDITGDMEYRKVKIKGAFDNDHSIVRLNQYVDSRLGYSLLTPLILSDGTAVMIDRGWIPAEGNGTRQDWLKYAVDGEISLSGIIRRSINIEKKDISKRPEFWIDFDKDQVQQLYEYQLSPVFIQVFPTNNQTEPPLPMIATVEITDGPHAGYALQWFTFALILLLGYPFFLKTTEAQKNVNK